MGDAPRYQVLADRLAALLRGGTFVAGDRLPSVRQLSREHRVSVSTAIAAVRKLEDAGLVEARPRSGYYVKPPNPGSGRMPRISEAGAKPIRIERVSLFEALMDTVADPKVVPFAAAAPDDTMVPQTKLASISNGIFRRYGGAALSYTLPPGRHELRVAVSKRLLGAGIQASPDEIITTHGATEALLMALRATTKPGDLVAVETPTYFGILHLVRDLGLRAIEVSTSPDDGLVVDALETILRKHRVKACVIQPNFQNPIGGRMPASCKKRVADLSIQYGFTVIEDDVYGELAHDGVRHPSISLYGGDVIHCGSISKTLAPGLRVGWVVPGPHFGEIKRLKSIQCPWNATLSELMVAEFLEAGGYDRHLRRIRQIYAGQCARMRQAVVAHFPEACRVNQPQGGFVLWVEMPVGFDSEAFAAQAMAKRISVVPGPVFSASGGLKNCFRLSCGFAFGERTLGAIATLGKIAARQG
jgi:DNA-binding transcriptional MocR family regulator